MMNEIIVVFQEKAEILIQTSSDIPMYMWTHGPNKLAQARPQSRAGCDLSWYFEV